MCYYTSKKRWLVTLCRKILLIDIIFRRQDDLTSQRLKHYGAHDSQTTKKFQNFGFRPQEFKREFSAQPQVPFIGPVSYSF